LAFQRGSQLRSLRTKKRAVSWGFGPQAVAITATSSVPVLWTSGIVLVAESEVTIVRTRGVFSAILTSTAAAGDGFAGAVGIGIVNTAAFLAGTASLPTPLNESDWPGWMYYRHFDLRAQTTTLADGVNALASTRFEIDSKAMRKFGADETLMGIIEVVEVGTASMIIHADTRILFKLV